MSIRIQAWVDRPTPPDAVVIVDGYSLAHAVRKAVRGLGLGVGQTRSSKEIAPGEWQWDWSGTKVHVCEIASTEPMFVPLTKRIEKAKLGILKAPAIIDVRFDRRVTLSLSREAIVELDRGRAESGGRDAYVERLLLDAASRRHVAGTTKRPAAQGVRLYTDYTFIELGDQPSMPAPIREIQRVVSYDGNKYCEVLVDGRRVSVKAGYLYAEPPKPGTTPEGVSIATLLAFVSKNEART